MHGSLLDGDTKAGRRSGVLGIGRLDAARAQAPAGVQVRAAADDAPAVGAAVAYPLPDVADELLGAERARAVRVRGDRHGPTPAALRARAAGLLEHVAPRPRPAVGPARERLPLVAARQPDAAAEPLRRPRAERLGVGAGDVGRRMVGELRVGELGG